MIHRSLNGSEKRTNQDERKNESSQREKELSQREKELLKVFGGPESALGRPDRVGRPAWGLSAQREKEL